MTSDAINVAVCGGGACGLAVVLCLLEQVKKGSCIRSIHVFSKDDKIGPGLAYSHHCGNATINMRADTMGLFATMPRHFVHWMRSQGSLYADSQYPVRVEYGRYLSSLFEFAKTEAQLLNVTLQVFCHEIVSITTDSGLFKIISERGLAWIANKVVLALGNFAACSRPELVGRSNFFASPWPLDGLTSIPSSSSVCIIGSRLTAIEAALYLADNGHMGPVYLASRGGRLPKVQAKYPGDPYAQRYVLSILARDLEDLAPVIDPLRLLSERFQLFAKDLGIENWPEFLKRTNPLQQLTSDLLDSEHGTALWRSLVDSAAPFFERYWDCLSTNEQLAFNNDWRSLWYAYVHAMPYETGVRLHKALSEKKVQVITFDAIVSEKEAFMVSSSKERIPANYIVEASGFETDCTRIRSKLVQSLQSTNVLEKHPAGGFCVDRLSLESTGTKGIYVIGSLTSGTHFYTNGIDCNAMHAQRIARHLTGQPVQRPVHIALIMPADSEFWQRFVCRGTPEMLNYDLFPFVYLLADLIPASERKTSSSRGDTPSPSSSTVVREALRQNQGQDGSETYSTVDLQSLNSTFGTFVGSFINVDIQFCKLLERHHIDLILVCADAHSLRGILDSKFNVRHISRQPSFCLMSRSRDEEASSRLQLDTLDAGHGSGTKFEHHEQEMMRILNSFIEAASVREV